MCLGCGLKPSAIQRFMDTVLGHERTVAFLRSRIHDPPHLIITGPAGVGKTLLATAWIKEQLIYQGVTRPEDRDRMTLRFSSADDRGITTIRQRLLELVRRVRPVANTYAWVLMDDADSLPVVAQQALRRILELYVHQARFCLIAPSAEFFIEPIQSRCVRLQLNPMALTIHGPALARQVGVESLSMEDTLLCLGNASQYMLICRARAMGLCDIALSMPPVKLLLRLQEFTIRHDIVGVTDVIVDLWQQGYSFEDVISMLESVVRNNNGILTTELQHVLNCCAEGHISQIQNRVTLLDLIGLFSFLP